MIGRKDPYRSKGYPGCSLDWAHTGKARLTQVVEIWRVKTHVVDRYCLTCQTGLFSSHLSKWHAKILVPKSICEYN